jgi:hypothetical protein
MNTTTNKLLDDVIAKHHAVFKDELGAIKGVEPKLMLS